MANLGGLKPNEEIMAAAFSLTSVYMIFASQTPNMSDVRAANPGNAIVHRSIKGATVEAAAVVSGVALLAKSPTVFVVGGLATVVAAWHAHWANHSDPVTGKPARVR